MNRIREAREKANLSQGDLGKLLGVTRQTISSYERGQREPKETTWSQISDLTKMPVPYLKGSSNDANGWDEWQKNTGFTKDAIEDEIERMKKTHRFSGDEDLQYLIAHAVSSLEGEDYTDSSAIDFVSTRLRDLSNEVGTKYYDPYKIAKAKEREGSFLPGTLYADGSLIFDDMSNETFQELTSILRETRDRVEKLKGCPK